MLRIFSVSACVTRLPFLWLSDRDRQVFVVFESLLWSVVGRWFAGAMVSGGGWMVVLVLLTVVVVVLSSIVRLVCRWSLVRRCWLWLDGGVGVGDGGGGVVIDHSYACALVSGGG